MDIADIALSTALSATLAIAVGLGLALTTKHLPRSAVATALAALAIAFSVAAARLSRSTGARPSPVRPANPMQWPARWAAAGVAACCLLVGLAGYLGWRLYVTPAPSSSYTVLGLEQHANRRAIVVVNHEGTTMHFRLVISEGKHIVTTRAFTLATGAKYQLELPASLPVLGTSRHELARLMTEPSDKPYRTLAF